jgi:ubiquinol-cytochrome c reductase cytochrome c1 subunit
MFIRPGRPYDRFKSPFPNANAARAANNGAFPPDLSVITKARPHGADYLYALMTGYKKVPAGMKMPEGMQYNTAFAGSQIAMVQPLSEGAVEYKDGTKASVAQMAKDVTVFMSWAAEPEMEERKRMGFKVILFLRALCRQAQDLERRALSQTQISDTKKRRPGKPRRRLVYGVVVITIPRQPPTAKQIRWCLPQ